MQKRIVSDSRQKYFVLNPDSVCTVGTEQVGIEFEENLFISAVSASIGSWVSAAEMRLWLGSTLPLPLCTRYS